MSYQLLIVLRSHFVWSSRPVVCLRDRGIRWFEERTNLGLIYSNESNGSQRLLAQKSLHAAIRAFNIDQSCQENYMAARSILPDSEPTSSPRPHGGRVRYGQEEVHVGPFAGPVLGERSPN